MGLHLWSDVLSDLATLRPWEELVHLGARPRSQRAFSTLGVNSHFLLVPMGDPDFESRVSASHLPICEGSLAWAVLVKKSGFERFFVTEQD